MAGKFVIARETKPEVLDWGKLGWMSNPPITGAKQLTVIDVTLAPGKGHDFHKHPDQEEVIYVVAGEVEQWVDQQSRRLGPGDSAFIPADVVHASFNVGNRRREDRRDPRPLRRPDRLRAGGCCGRGAVEGLAEEVEVPRGRPLGPLSRTCCRVARGRERGISERWQTLTRPSAHAEGTLTRKARGRSIVAVGDWEETMAENNYPKLHNAMWPGIVGKGIGRRRADHPARHAARR